MRTFGEVNVSAFFGPREKQTKTFAVGPEAGALPAGRIFKLPINLLFVRIPMVFIHKRRARPKQGTVHVLPVKKNLDEVITGITQPALFFNRPEDHGCFVEEFLKQSIGRFVIILISRNGERMEYGLF